VNEESKTAQYSSEKETKRMRFGRSLQTLYMSHMMKGKKDMDRSDKLNCARINKDSNVSCMIRTLGLGIICAVVFNYCFVNQYVADLFF
jgi:hypothetical protein